MRFLVEFSQTACSRAHGYSQFVVNVIADRNSELRIGFGNRHLELRIGFGDQKSCRFAMLDRKSVQNVIFGLNWCEALSAFGPK